MPAPAPLPVIPRCTGCPRKHFLAPPLPPPLQRGWLHCRGGGGRGLCNVDLGRGKKRKRNPRSSVLGAGMPSRKRVSSAGAAQQLPLAGRPPPRARRGGLHARCPRGYMVRRRDRGEEPSPGRTEAACPSTASPAPVGEGGEKRGLSHPPAPESASRPSPSAPSSAPASAEPPSPSSRAPFATAIAAAAAGGWRPNSRAGRAGGPAWRGWLNDRPTDRQTDGRTDRPDAPLLPLPPPPRSRAGSKGTRSPVGKREAKPGEDSRAGGVGFKLEKGFYTGLLLCEQLHG